MDGDDQSNLSTLTSITENNLKIFTLEYSDLNSKLTSLDKLYPLKDFTSSKWMNMSKCDELKAFIALKMTDIITFIDNNGKLAIYKGLNIHVIYSYP